MSNALLQQIANPFVPDIPGAFRQGQERARQDRSRNALGRVLGGDKAAMPELLQNDPQAGFELQKYYATLDENSRKNLAQNTEQFARRLYGVAQIKDPAMKQQGWQQTMDFGRSLGINTSPFEGLGPDNGGLEMAASYVLPVAELAKQARGEAPIEVSPGATMYDPRTNKPIFTAPDRRSDSKRTLVDKPLPDGTVQKVWVDESGQEIGPFGAPTKPKGAGGPMPATIIKALRESREALRAAQSMNKTMEQTRALVKGKEAAPDAKAVPPLEIGPLDRVAGAARNYVGAGNANSQGLQELKRVREKLRSDYLLLSKGVQTEGDANRAMDAMMPDTNDPQVLLNQIDKLEQASQDLQAMHEESVRSIETEYGREPADLAPLGPPQAPAAPGGFRVIRRK